MPRFFRQPPMASGQIQPTEEDLIYDLYEPPEPQPRSTAQYAQPLSEIFWEGASAGALGGAAGSTGVRILSEAPGAIPAATASELFYEPALRRAMERSSLPWTGSEVVQMDPEDFRALALDLDPLTSPGQMMAYEYRGLDPSSAMSEWPGGPSPSKMAGVRAAIESGTPLRDIPYLAVDEAGRVVQHEGRHRASALRELGYPTMPVEVISSDMPGSGYERLQTLASESPSPRMSEREALMRGWPLAEADFPPVPEAPSAYGRKARYNPAPSWRSRAMPAADLPPAKLPLGRRIGAGLKTLARGLSGPKALAEAMIFGGAGGLSSAYGYHKGRPDIETGVANIQFPEGSLIQRELERPDPYTGEVPTLPYEMGQVQRATVAAEARKEGVLRELIDQVNLAQGAGTLPPTATIDDVERYMSGVSRGWPAWSYEEALAVRQPRRAEAEESPEEMVERMESAGYAGP